MVVWTGALQYDSTYMPPGLDQEIMDRVSALGLTVIDPLFSPVMTVSLFVSLFGVVLLGLSFFFQDRRALPMKPPPIPRD